MHPLNEVSFAPLSGGSLLKILKIAPPAFRTATETFVQLQYVEDYIRRTDLSDLPERCVAIESHYIDRDFMADYSVLFASTLLPPPNFCRRVHFFAGKPDLIESELTRVASILLDDSNDKGQRHDAACRDFSARYYLGFSVIRPLAACPVGRTVLRLLPGRKPEEQAIRMMSCTREYRTHFMGTELTIRGLAFQQQDLGVSRCSTIALWCALHKAAEAEHMQSATPAEITNLASKHRLPFGRPMPSEGLAVDQMCLALQSLGVAPFLCRVESYAQARSLIYAATRSGMPCVLIMQKSTGNNLWHAVTVTGMKLRGEHEVSLVDPSKPGAGDDLSGDLKAVYVQDDRVGPYRRAEMLNNAGKLSVRIKVESHIPLGKTQDWQVHQVLVPVHPKIRVSFNDLRRMTRDWLMPELQKVVTIERGIEDLQKLPPVKFEFWIERGHRYVGDILSQSLLEASAALQFSRTSVMPRYLAVIRLSHEDFGAIDVLVDTTSPRPNHHWVGVVAHRATGSAQQLCHTIAEYLAEKCGCRYYN